MEKLPQIQTNSAELRKLIMNLRNTQVMIDRDLASLYQVETKALNQAVKRNIERFPASFSFQVTDNEKMELVTNCDRFESLKHSSTKPYAFTEQGIAMLSTVLRSEVAVKISIQIMEAFVEMRSFLLNNAALFQRLHSVEQKQQLTDKRVDALFAVMEAGSTPPKQGVFYDGQVFDAYVFINKLIKSAKKTITLIDNYIDETVLEILTARKPKVTVTLLTHNISKKLELDIKKHNEQYPGVELKTFNKSHDRFLILDQQEVYHIGASLKDLGKKWFAFSKLDLTGLELLKKAGVI